MTNFEVKRYRTLMNLTQGAFAELLGIRQSALSKIESGIIPVGEHRDKISAVFAQWKSERIEGLKKEIEFIQTA